MLYYQRVYSHSKLARWDFPAHQSTKELFERIKLFVHEAKHTSRRSRCPPGKKVVNVEWGDAHEQQQGITLYHFLL